MSTETNQSTPTITSVQDIDSLSDNDLAQLDLNSLVTQLSSPQGTTQTENKDVPLQTDENEDGTDKQTDENLNTDKSSQENTENIEQNNTELKNSDEENKNEEEENSSENKETEETTQESSEIDYKKFYQTIMEDGIKVNGKLFKPRSIDEVKRLISMGSDYNRKMSDLKPTRKIISMLENNQLLDENKLNELLNIYSGDTQAILNFLKNKNIDLQSLDLEENATDYKPKDFRVSDVDMNFSIVSDELKSTSQGIEVLNYLAANVQDTNDRATLYTKPEYLRKFHLHSQHGVFQQVVNELERGIAMGNPNMVNLPFIDAYQNALETLELENRLELPPEVIEQFKQGKTQNRQVKVPQSINNQTKQKRTTQDNTDKKVAAALPTTTGKVPPTSNNQIKNPLDMDEEELDSLLRNLRQSGITV